MELAGSGVEAMIAEPQDAAEELLEGQEGFTQSMPMTQMSARAKRSKRESMANLFPMVVDAWRAGKLHDSLLPRLMTEAAGTFILVLAATIETSEPGSQNDMLASQGSVFAVPATVTVIVMVGAPISGAHYNPALTMAFWAAGERTHAERPLIYTFINLVAGIAAAAVSFCLDGNIQNGLPVPPLDTPDSAIVGEWAKICVGEVLAAFLFTSTVLYVAMLAKPPLGTFGPVAVGLACFATIMGFRFISGAFFNPAIVTGVWVVGMANGKQEDPWVSIFCFILSDLLGGALAGGAVRLGLAYDSQSRRPDSAFDSLPGDS